MVYTLVTLRAFAVSSAMLSYQADMTIENNPYELGLGRLVDLDMEADFVSKSALKRIHAEGVRQALVGSPLTDHHWWVLTTKTGRWCATTKWSDT